MTDHNAIPTTAEAAAARSPGGAEFLRQAEAAAARRGQTPPRQSSRGYALRGRRAAAPQRRQARRG